ncbi:MAG TPA: diacylglycerol kinase family protein [Thermoanaerobaculia bacterium]|nr:diacylglycerol kinase family protein [Thermoanaerobaculia bacterium]
MRDTLVLVNPRAGSGKAARVWEELRGQVPAERVVVIDGGDARGAAGKLDAALAAPGIERLIALGGDGTVHLAANRLFATGRQGEVALGMVAAGTGSDLATTLSLPREPRRALEHALAAPPSPLDVVRITCGAERRVVLNVASAGISGPVAERVNRRVVRRATVYVSATLATLAEYRPFPVRVTVDGAPWYEGGVLLLAVANGPRFGKGMRVAPEASVTDGLADVVLVPPMPAWKVPYRLPRLFTGTILQVPWVRWCRARRVAIEPLAPAPPYEVDGETIPSGAAELELLPGAVRFLLGPAAPASPAGLFPPAQTPIVQK